MNLVFVGTDRHLHRVDAERNRFALTEPPAMALVQVASEVWSWPSWSPDGSSIAAFSTLTRDDASGPVRVMTVSPDGVCQTEWVSLDVGAPLYLQWHPGGRALCVVTNVDKELTLGLVRDDRLGDWVEVATGVPLFFNWTPGGRRLWVHLGESGQSRTTLQMRDPLGDADDAQFDGSPGNFCAPVFVGERALIAVRHPDQGSQLVSVNAQGEDARVISERVGLVGIAAIPGRLAVGWTADGQSSSYAGLERVDDDGSITRIFTQPLLAFFWVPDGSALIGFRTDAADNCMSVLRIDGETGAEQVLGTFWPTRDMFFWLHFFDQFADSHPIVSPDSVWVTWAGYPAGGGQADLSSPPRIFLCPVSGGAAPEVLGRGVFAVFPPRTAA